MSFEAGKTYVFDDPPYDELRLFLPFEDIVVASAKTRNPILLIETFSLEPKRWWVLTDKGRFVIYERDMLESPMHELERYAQMMNNDS
jgi:hypothetical protein